MEHEVRDGVPTAVGRLAVNTVDYHTAGEPYRIVVGGVPPLTGATVLDRRSDAMARLDHVRRFLVNEPRGHADMYGCFVTPPDDDGAEFGMVFFHKDGFSTACGHGTVAGATWAIDTGMIEVEARDAVARFNLDVPSGRLAVEADVNDGRVGEVRFTNVAAQVRGADVVVGLDDGTEVDVTVGYGGAHYAVLAAAAVGLAVEPVHVDEFIHLGRAIKAALAGHPAAEHPTDDRLSGLYGVIFFDDDPAPGVDGATLRQRNITIFADGSVDRSPCGSGTSARLAVLHHEGKLGVDEVLSHRGIAGGLFSGRVVSAGSDGVITQVGGRASLSGYHTFVLEPDDELGLGFQLR